MRHDTTAIQTALGDRYTAVDYDEFLQIVDADGNHVGLVGFEPLQVEVELSVVFLSDRDLDDLVPEAHDVLVKVHDEVWEPAGFQRAAQGEVREGTALEDEEHVIHSYDLPTTVRAKDPDQVREILDWVTTQDTDFVL